VRVSLILSSNHFECEAARLDEASRLGVGSFTLPEAVALSAMGANIRSQYGIPYNVMVRFFVVLDLHLPSVTSTGYHHKAYARRLYQRECSTCAAW
jgi:hypothetical protein